MNSIKYLITLLLTTFVCMCMGATTDTSFQTDSLTFGRPAAADKTLHFRKGTTAASDPAIKWNNSASQLQFSNDGSTYQPIGTSGDSSRDIINLGYATSVGSNALTVALKTKAGTDASSTDIVKVGFRNATATTGTYSIVNITGALSVVVSSGSTLGTISNISQAVYVYLINNAGTAELAVSRSLFDDGSIVSTTAEGGAGAADSSGVMYSTTARSNVPSRLVGRITITETTAGTWASNATELSVVPFKLPVKVLIASGYIAQTASCTWSRTNTTLGAFGTTAACPGVTVVSNVGPGVLQTTDTDLPKFTMNDLPQGDYEVVIYGAGYACSANAEGAGIALSDGTTTTVGQTMIIIQSSTHYNPIYTTYTFSYATTANKTFELFGAANSARTINVQNNTTSVPTGGTHGLSFLIYKLYN